jgi:hypothetical protein
MLPVRISACVYGLVRRALPASAALAAGLMLRLWMMKEFFQVYGDTLIYGVLAKNLLLHGNYALTTGTGEMYPTLIRLPGYPLFLALCFRLFGMENYASAAWVQIALELCGCMLLADFARRIAPAELKAGAALATLWLAALCPFTASYSVAPLTEAPTLFVVALALWAVARFHARPGWGSALAFTFAVSYAALLRPDGALVGVALAPALLVRLYREKKATGPNQPAEKHDTEGGGGFNPRMTPPESTPALAAEGHDPPISHEIPPLSTASEDITCQSRPPKLLRMAMVCVLLALLPFGAWTWRNWNVFHVFQPLASRTATDPGEDTHPGWESWVKTWCLDFVSTYDIYWNVPGDQLDLTKLPARAFDSPTQYDESAALAAAYNNTGHDITPVLDARFAGLAQERIAADPLRYYVWLPLGRLADMWLRPRVENLPIDLDWWVFAHHNAETRISWAYAGLNALYLLLGIAGLCLRPRFWPSMLAYMLLRSALLLTVGAPEARYTLECFPMLFALGGIGLYWFTTCVWRLVSRVNALAGRR